ncbi:MAG: hypothetical protein LBL50_00360 [Candidatus Margulisbacteria bacterium]|jgi:hypothetical protein|nr:hypothetical protein [Candidatus Margulisiibacteriota bacterium]
MRFLCAKLWEYSELPQPYSYPLKSEGKKLVRLSWADFQKIPSTHWRKLLKDLCDINARCLIVDFADNKVRYNAKHGFIFLACYAGEPALSWESARLAVEIIKAFQRAAVRHEQTLNSPAEKTYFYREMDNQLMSLYDEVSLCFFAEKTKKTTLQMLVKLLGVYQRKLKKTKYSPPDNFSRSYSLSV